MSCCCCCSVMSDSLRHQELHRARLSYPSLFPGVCSNSCPLNRWCHPTLLSSVIPFSSFSSVQLLSNLQLFVTPWTAARQASLSITNTRSLLKLVSIELVMPSNHLILCHPLLLLPSIFPSIRVFSNESSLPISWPKYWSFSFSISPSNEYSGLISFMMDWLDPCSPRDSQESFPIPEFKSINSLALSFFYSPTLTSIHDHWKNYSFD